VIKDVINLEGLHGITSREDMFIIGCGTMCKSKLPWTIQKEMKIEGVPSTCMSGKKTGLMSTDRHNMNK
jgi:hypothetical protein